MDFGSVSQTLGTEKNKLRNYLAEQLLILYGFTLHRCTDTTAKPDQKHWALLGIPVVHGELLDPGCGCSPLQDSKSKQQIQPCISLVQTKFFWGWIKGGKGIKAAQEKESCKVTVDVHNSGN